MQGFLCQGSARSVRLPLPQTLCSSPSRRPGVQPSCVVFVLLSPPRRICCPPNRLPQASTFGHGLRAISDTLLLAGFRCPSYHVSFSAWHSAIGKSKRGDDASPCNSGLTHSSAASRAYASIRKHGQPEGAGIMGCDEEIKFPPLPCDCDTASGHALPDLPPHGRVPAGKSQRGPDRALPPGPSRSARHSFPVVGSSRCRRSGTCWLGTSLPQSLARRRQRSRSVSDAS
jgi:hypothetical protein